MSQLLETIRNEDRRASVGFDVVRVYLGVALFVRGALFIAHPDRISRLVETSSDWFVPMAIAHYVGMAHLGGGILLTLGLATRAAALAQVPVLLGAVFLVHWQDGLLNPSQSLELAGLVLALLVAYSLFGAGPLSLDARIRESARAERGDGIPPPPASVRP